MKATLAGRLVLGSTVTIVAVLAVQGVLIDRFGHRPAIVVGTVVAAAVAGVAAMWIVARRLQRSVLRVTEGVRAMTPEDPGARISPQGPAELVLLAEAVNRMADGVEARMGELRQERRQLEHILEAMDEGVVLVEADGRMGFANAAARRILRGAPADLRSLASHGLRELVEEARAGPGPGRREIETGVPARTIAATAQGVRDGTEVLLVLRDVTAARRVEAMRRDFVADASHELKTPAASIRAAAETLQRAVGDDPAAAARFAAQLGRDAERLSRIVSDLLDLSRLESERPSFEDVRLDLVVAEQVEAARDLAREAGISLQVRTAPATVKGSERDLRLLVGNLLDNALRYTPSGGRVDAEVGARGDEAFLSVSDTGMGIPSRDLPRIFERFFRVDRARSRDTGGTGLGLSIVRHVAEQHGGRVEARSELERGSTFRVHLPAIP